MLLSTTIYSYYKQVTSYVHIITQLQSLKILLHVATVPKTALKTCSYLTLQLLIKIKTDYMYLIMQSGITYRYFNSYIME